MQQFFPNENWFDWGLMYVKYFLIHRPDLPRTGYQTQAISSLEQGQVCEDPAAHQNPKFWLHPNNNYSIAWPLGHEDRVVNNPWSHWSVKENIKKAMVKKTVLQIYKFYTAVKRNFKLTFWTYDCNPSSEWMDSPTKGYSPKRQFKKSFHCGVEAIFL